MADWVFGWLVGTICTAICSLPLFMGGNRKDEARGILVLLFSWTWPITLFVASPILCGIAAMRILRAMPNIVTDAELPMLSKSESVQEPGQLSLTEPNKQGGLTTPKGESGI